METKYLVLSVSALTEYGGWINGAVLKVDDAFRERMADLRRRREKAEADLELFDDTPTFVDDYERLAGGEELTEMDAGWNPNDMEVSSVEFVPPSWIHVTKDGVYWSLNEKHADVSYETALVPYEKLDLPVRRGRRTLDQLSTSLRRAYDKVRPHVVGATARKCRELLAQEPELDWVKVKFNESDQEGTKLFLTVELSNDFKDNARPARYSQDADEVEDALMNHLDLYELFFEPGEYIKVTREKAFVPKGWKTSWRPL